MDPDDRRTAAVEALRGPLRPCSDERRARRTAHLVGGRFIQSPTSTSPK
jgi:hypothetical protein